MNIPNDIRLKIKELVYDEADKHSYLNRSRTENAEFMDNLIAHPKIGGVLKLYLSTGKIKTYIKDAILNRYSKDRMAVSPDGIKDLLSDTLNEPVTILAGTRNSGVTVCKAQSGIFYVVATGTFLKWETALRKVLLYVISKERELKQLSNNNEIKTVIVISSPIGSVNTSDKALLLSALNRINVKVLWAA